MADVINRWQLFTDFTSLLRGSPPTEVRARLDPSIAGRHAYWEALVALAERHRMAASLWSCLVREGLAASPPPAIRSLLAADSIVLLLERDWLRNRERLADLVAQARAIIAAFNAVGIEPLLLKGMSLYFSGVHDDPVARWMVDIDLLVRGADLAVAEAAMASLGYVPKADDTGAPHHLAPLMRPGSWGSVELHFLPLLPRAGGALPVDAAWRDAVAVEGDGLRYRHLSPGHRLLHTAIGGQESDWNYASLNPPLRALWDFTLLAVGAEIDWEAIAATADAAGFGRPFEAHLLQANRLFGLPWPFARPPSLPARLHWWLCIAAERWPWPIRRIAIVLNDLRYAYSRESLTNMGLLREGNGGLFAARGRLLVRHLRKHRLGLGLADRLFKRP